MTVIQQPHQSARVALPIPYVDTCAADLSFTLDGPLLPGLAERHQVATVAGRELTLSLRILGHSHQAVCTARRPASGGVEPPEPVLVETLAYLDNAGPGLPASTHRDLGQRDLGTVDYRCTVQVLSDVDFSREIDRWYTADPDVTASFPGHPDAITAISWSAHPGRLSWRTLHGYPGSGELVLSASVIAERRPK